MNNCGSVGPPGAAGQSILSCTSAESLGKELLPFQVSLTCLAELLGCRIGVKSLFARLLVHSCCTMYQNLVFVSG